MSSGNANTMANTAPLIPSKEIVNQSAPPQNLAANGQFLLSNPALSLSAAPADAKLHKTTEVVDLYVVKFDEGIPLAGNSSEVKCMVIDSPSPPQFQTILGSFPKTPFQYDVAPQYPTASAFNRDKAIAGLKDSVLAAYMAQRQGKVPTPTAIPPLPQVPALPSIISAPFGNPINSAATQPVLPSANTAGFAIDAPAKQTNGAGNGIGRVTTPVENGDMMDFGGFFPMGTAFIADDVEFVVEADPAAATAATITPPVSDLATDRQVTPEAGSAVASSVEPAPHVAPSEVPVPVVETKEPQPVQEIISVPAKQEASTAMDAVAAEKPTQENTAAVEKAPSPAAVPEVPAAKAVEAPVMEAPSAPLAAVNSGEAMDVVPPTPVEAAEPKQQLSDPVAADVPKSVTPLEKPISLEKPAEKSVTLDAPVKVEKLAEVPGAPVVNSTSGPKTEVETAVVKKEDDAQKEGAKPAESADKEVPVPVSEDKTSTKISSQVELVVEPTESKKRPIEVVADDGLQTWKKRCLTEKSLPTFDEATDILQKVGADGSKQALLRRHDIDGKSLRDLIANLSQTAKNIKKKPKAGGNGASSGEALGQSMWDKTGDPDAEENTEKGGESSGKAQVEWVQCDACAKWRTLPVPTHPKYPSALDEDKGWICSMNSWAPHLANCQVPEESMLSPTAIKIRIWLRRIRTGDKYEARNNLKPSYEKKSSGGTSINSVPVDWIRCCSPVCGKWRACLRTMNGQDVKNIQYPWYCWMASWDETKATCSAPQEGFTVQGYNVAVTETEDNNSNSAPGNAAQAGSQCGAALNGNSSNGGGARRSGYSRSDNGDETVSNADTADDGGDDEPPPTIGISSRGRIVRSKFNVRKHLASSKK